MDEKEFRELAGKQQYIDGFASKWLARNDQREEPRYRKALLDAIEKGGAKRAARHLEAAFRSGGLVEDRKAALEGVAVSGWMLEYSSEALRGDREVVLQAVKQSGYVLQYASEELKNDKDVVLQSLQIAAFRFAAPAVRSDREVALAAIRQKASEVRYCTEELRGDKSFVLEAIGCEGMLDPPSLYYAPEHLWNDPELLAATGEREKTKADLRERSGFNDR